MRLGGWTLVASLVLLGAEALAQVSVPRSGIRLDVPADWGPVLCEGRLYVFSSEGRNQVLSAGDEAPQCDPVQFSPLLQPVCGAGGPLVLDRDGDVWQLGQGLPKTIQAGFKDAVALWTAAGKPVILFKDRLEWPGGQRVALPFEAKGGTPLSDGGCWVWGTSKAARVGPSGEIRWSWSPPAGAPGPAALGDNTLFAGTSSGALWFLRDRDGKARYAYQGGGAVRSPAVVSDALVIYASEDHFIRAVGTKDGQLAWQFRMEGRPLFGPYAVAAGLLVGEAGGNRLIILAPKTGKQVWSWKTPSGAILRPPAVAGDLAAALAWDESATPLLCTVALPSRAPIERKGEKPAAAP